MLKRLVDIVGSLVALTLLSPIIAFTAWKVSKTMGAPVLFKQLRPGRNGKVFKMVKFRTMKDATGNDGRQLPDEERITPYGNFMRRSSLDELPGLWNVLKGDMSLVGPRPLLVEYLPLYTKEQNRRHEVKPGITGWAQVNGRNAISWKDKFNLDVWYVDNHNFWLDIKILFLTVKKVIFKEDINHAGEATMHEFSGSKTDD